MKYCCLFLAFSAFSFDRFQTVERIYVDNTEFYESAYNAFVSSGKLKIFIAPEHSHSASISVNYANEVCRLSMRITSRLTEDTFNLAKRTRHDRKCKKAVYKFIKRKLKRTNL